MKEDMELPDNAKERMWRGLGKRVADGEGNILEWVIMTHIQHGDWRIKSISMDEMSDYSPDLHDVVTEWSLTDDALPNSGQLTAYHRLSDDAWFISYDEYGSCPVLSIFRKDGTWEGDVSFNPED